MFRVGMKVVCVDASDFGHRISEGGVYTIESIAPADSFVYSWLRLVEVTPLKGGYRSTRFRPLVERKTDISIFTEMLTPSSRELERQP